MPDTKERPDAYVATVLDSQNTPPGEPTPRETAGEPDALKAGAFVGGRYRVVRFIARGGMGEVYEAFDEELRVAVALKVATKTTGRALDRFKREVTLARRVTHRNVCRLFEIGFETLAGETVPYCTMELLGGETLSERLERGPLAIADARAIVDQITAGLGAAHDVGVIHRDFKSNNIILVKDGDGGERAVISDFGLARAEPGVVGDGSNLTADQALVGTPAYMAPEQVECKPATTATDIYALGVVMFELVTGDLPFRADTPMATAVLRLTQPPPSARTRRPELPASWDLAIRRCLELSPAARFARAAEVREALDAAPPRRILPWAIGGGALAAAAIAAAVGLPVRGEHASARAIPKTVPGHVRGLVITDPTASDAWRGTEAGELLRAELRVPGSVMPLDGDETAPLARMLAGANDGETRKSAVVRIGATTTAQILITGSLRPGELRVQLIDLASGQPIEDYAQPIAGDDLAGAIAHLGTQLRDRLAGADVALDADHTAKVLPAQPDAARAYAEGLAAARAHDHLHAIAALEQATSLAKDFAPAYIALVGELRAVRQRAKAAKAAETAFSLAGSLRSDQRLRAEALYRESRSEWPQAGNLWSTLLAAQPDDVDVACALAKAVGNDDATKCYPVLDRLRERPAPIGDDPRLDVQEALCARQAGDFRRALSAATRADVKAEVRGAREVQQSALALEGEQLANAGEYDRALVVLGRARHVAESLGDREAQLEDMRQAGFVLGEQGKLEEAMATYKAAIDSARQIGYRLLEGILMNDLGQVLPRASDALAMFQDCLAIAKEQGDERLITAASLNVGNKQDALGDYEGALATYADVIARAKTQHDDENLATALMNSGNTMMRLERYPQAVPRIDEALASFEERGDEDGVGYALMSRATAHLGQGDFTAARTDFEASLAKRAKLGETRNVAKTQIELARLDLEEDKPADAEPLARAAVTVYRGDGDVDELANGLRTLARVLITLGKRDEATAAIDESDRIIKPDANAASEDALIRGLADPAHADAQLAIIHASQRDPSCHDCGIIGLLDEAQLERGLGHTARAHALLVQVRERAKAVHSADVVARVTRLLAQ